MFRGVAGLSAAGAKREIEIESRPLRGDRIVLFAIRLSHVCICWIGKLLEKKPSVGMPMCIDVHL